MDTIISNISMDSLGINGDTQEYSKMILENKPVIEEEEEKQKQCAHNIQINAFESIDAFNTEQACVRNIKTYLDNQHKSTQSTNQLRNYNFCIEHKSCLPSTNIGNSNVLKSKAQTPCKAFSSQQLLQQIYNTYGKSNKKENIPIEERLLKRGKMTQQKIKMKVYNRDNEFKQMATNTHFVSNSNIYAESKYMKDGKKPSTAKATLSIKLPFESISSIKKQSNDSNRNVPMTCRSNFSKYSKFLNS